MKRLSSRMKITLLSSVFLSIMAIVATIYKQETTAVTALTGIMTILSTHVWLNKRKQDD